MSSLFPYVDLDCLYFINCYDRIDLTPRRLRIIPPCALSQQTRDLRSRRKSRAIGSRWANSSLSTAVVSSSLRLGRSVDEADTGISTYALDKLLRNRADEFALQMLPVPLALLGTVKEHFIEQGMRGSVVYEDEATLASDVWEGTTDHYFRVAWAGVAPLEEGGEPQEIKGELVHIIHEDKGRFDLQFGRTTLATLLQMEDRIDWKSCTGSVVEEKRDVTLFKKGFAAFDPSL